MDVALDSLPVQDVSPTPEDPKTGHPKVSRALSQLVIMQELLFSDAQSTEYKGPKRAMITRAWKELQELRLRISMKPAPKPIDVAPKRKPAVEGDPGWRKPKVLPTPVPDKPHSKPQ